MTMLRAAWEGLISAIYHLQCKFLILEGDSPTVVSWISKTCFVDSSLWDVKSMCCPSCPSSNALILDADNLAGMSSTCDFGHTFDIPSYLTQLNKLNAAGICYLHCN